ncbi:hypothetical protein GQ43DRAFT_462111 [Delitschia confertaspora ATCC 74209]|uniref:Uncharacterized protein n=1 Tax=Delitschia confertaspora ATCC 74209 TaxID=1513339 RepID=A0A9P4MX39_9PLEO|nr:hypothetical protein GQ43DRAFT_462111 [Delitschia confertaspora ATCC 74209]
MPPKSTSSNEVVLRDYLDWEIWIYIFKRIAETEEIWEHIDREQRHRPQNRPEKHTKPIVAAHSAKSNRSDGSAITPPPVAMEFNRYRIKPDEYYRGLRGLSSTERNLNQMTNR